MARPAAAEKRLTEKALPLRHVQAPESFHNMPITDLALGMDPRKAPVSRKSWTKPVKVTDRMDRIATAEMKRDTTRNRKYLLHQSKQNDLLVRRPAGTDDHITRATRLIEAERMTSEVDEALRSVKDGFAAEMDRCGKRKNDSVRKTTALVEAMHNFSDFVATNDYWTAHNTRKAEEDERLAKIYAEEHGRLLEEQKAELKTRATQRRQLHARRAYNKLLDDVLAETSGDFNGVEHLITELEQQVAIINLAKDAEEKKRKIQAEADTFRTRLQTAMSVQLRQMADKEKALQQEKERLRAVLFNDTESEERLEAHKNSAIQEYLHLRRSVRDIYATACDVLGQGQDSHRKDLPGQLQTISQCLMDSRIVQTAVNHVFDKTDKRKGRELPKQKLDEVTSLVGSGFFPHLTFKVDLTPAPRGVTHKVAAN